jgi:methylmalonyl-CoA/ethylmalonyl-CoA epimerase
VRALSLTPPTSCPDPSPKDWRLGRLNHVAIAVPDLDKATSLYRDVLGAKVSDVVVSSPALQHTDSIISVIII